MKLLARFAAICVLLSSSLTATAQLYPEEYTVIHEKHSGEFVNNWERAVIEFSPNQPFHIDARTTPYINDVTMETFITFWKDGVLIAVDDENVFHAEHIRLFNQEPANYMLVLTYGSTYGSNVPNFPMSSQYSDQFLYDKLTHLRAPLTARERGVWEIDLVLTLVPEPSAYAMWLAGLLVAGLAVRRGSRGA